MKGKIDILGNLQIERKVKYKEQACPFQPFITKDESDVPCGDWCPLFGEPDTFKTDTNKLITKLEICGKRVLVLTEFTDERE